MTVKMHQKWLVANIEGFAIMMMHDTDNYNICINLEYKILHDDMEFMEAFRFQQGYNHDK